MGKIIGMLKAKKFMTYSHENMIFVNPALIITEEQLREEMVKVDEVLTEVDSSQSELRLPLLQVVSSNKYFSVGVQSPTEINAPRGCAVILIRYFR